ncbi:methionine aminotransferase [Aquimarina sp. W85]|uniref:methionine aminotransferase n=1 Tax=Aquimarina rhodophyticola TaxID=3342246 RepID=UPI00366CE96F
MKPLLSKLPVSHTTIFTVMSELANQYQALNLSQGFPDFPVDPELITLVSKAMKSGKNQYSPMAGLMQLRERIAEKVANSYGYTYHPETEITITSGATQALFTCIAAFIHPKDEVIIFEPAYDCYEPSIRLFGGVTIPIQLSYPNYTIDWDQVAEAITPKTRMIIINTPHNPSGTTMSSEDMAHLEKLVATNNIIVLSDEVYEHIIFDSTVHQSVARYPSLASRSFIIGSFGKTFHVTGWKTGYCLAPSALMKEFRKVHQYNVFSGNHPIQAAIAQYLETPSHYLSLPDFYQHKRDLFLSLLKGSSFTHVPATGTYFQLLEYSAITNENDLEFAKRLTKEYKIASIPISVFNSSKQDDKVLRFCFAKSDETLKRAAEVLHTV